MIAVNEGFSLLLALVFAPLIMRTIRDAQLQASRSITLALFAIVASYVCTIAEGFVAAAAFDAAEHIFLALAGILFVAAGLEAMGYFERAGRSSS